MTSLLHPPVFRVAGQHANRVLLASEVGATVEIFVLEDDIVRVRVLPDATARNPRTWSIAPGLDDVPLDGRDRLDLDGFTLPAYTLVEDDDAVCIETAQIRVAVRRQGGHCTWSIRGADGTWRVALADRATQAYNFGWWDDRAYHYVARERGDKVFGLGERAGDLDRTGARFEMRNIDAMGYSAKHTDPLYKHIPFYITWSPAACQGFGLFYDTLSDCAFDMGRELDNYHGPYRYFVAEHGDLDYYFIASPGTPLAAARRFTWLTGRPARTPKWGLGYSGSTMSYTDAPDAQQQMNQFVEQCGTLSALHDQLAERPRAVLVEQARSVVVLARQQEIGNGRHVVCTCDIDVNVDRRMRPTSMRLVRPVT